LNCGTTLCAYSSFVCGLSGKIKKKVAMRRYSFVPIQRMRHSRPFTVRIDSTQGPLSMPPDRGYINPHVYIDYSPYFGGQSGKGLFSRREMSYGLEIINVPAYLSHFGDEPLQEQVMVLTREVFKKLVADDPDSTFIMKRVLSMVTGGYPSYFIRERDLMNFAEELNMKEQLPRSAKDFLTGGSFTTSDLQRLPSRIEFNRYDVEFKGQRGICIFPEAQYFNHNCEANVEISISYSAQQKNFVLSARTCRPIAAGEELLIHYMPDAEKLPISRYALAMRERWGFECQCSKCRRRALQGVSIWLFALLIPSMIFVRRFFKERSDFRTRSF
jgi:hypothetical protein